MSPGLAPYLSNRGRQFRKKVMVKNWYGRSKLTRNLRRVIYPPHGYRCMNRHACAFLEPWVNNVIMW